MKLSVLEAVVAAMRKDAGKTDPEVDFWETSEARRIIREQFAAAKPFLSLELDPDSFKAGWTIPISSHKTNNGSYSLPLAVRQA